MQPETPAPHRTPVTPAPRQGTRNVFLLGLTSLFTDISSEMIYPLVPIFLTLTLGASPAIVGLIEGLAESLASLLKVFSGSFSDRIRRRKPLAIVGYSLSSISKLAFYLAGSWGIVLLGRLGDRFGKGVRTAPRDALIAESTLPGTQGWAFGLHRALDTLGAVIGVAAAYVLLVHWRGNLRPIFLVALLPAAVGVLFLGFAREKRAPTSAVGQNTGADSKTADTPQGSAWQSIVERVRAWFEAWTKLPAQLRWFLVLTFIFTLGNSSNQFLLLRATTLGFDAAAVLLLYLTFNVTYALSAYPAGLLSDRVGPTRLLIGGYATYALVYLGFALVHQPASAWMLFAIYGFYLGLTDGVAKAFVSRLTPPNQKATLLGLHAALEGVGLLPASALAGLLWTRISPSAPFAFGAVMGIVAAVGMLVLVVPAAAKTR